MTGFVDRLRSWLGSVFGAGSDGDGENASEGAESDPEPNVVHRDDRPLETPSNMSPPESEPQDGRPTASQTTESERNGRPDAGDAVSIPDAETVAEDPTETVAEDPTETVAEDPTETVAEDPTETAPSTPAVSGSAAIAEGESDDASSADAGTTTADAGEFACAVCGTAVDDPSEPCPLCRSTEVVPVADAEADDAPTRSERTSVSAADDDAAVNRLHDVQNDDA